MELIVTFVLYAIFAYALIVAAGATLAAFAAITDRLIKIWQAHGRT